MGQGVLLPVVVLPLLLLRDLVLPVLVLHLLVLLVVLVLQVQLILKHHLSISFLLHRPELLLVLPSLVLDSLIPNLLHPFSVYSLHLFRLQPFEMVSDISTFPELGDGSLGILSHELALDGLSDLELVLSFLVFLPVCFLVSLLLSKPLVLLLHLLHHVLPLLGHFILQHASHSGNSLSLLRVHSKPINTSSKYREVTYLLHALRTVSGSSPCVGP